MPRALGWVRSFFYSLVLEVRHWPSRPGVNDAGARRGDRFIHDHVSIYTNAQSDGGILNVAFRNPDGTIVVVAYNDSPDDSTITVNWDSKNFNYPLAAGSMVTFKWAGS